MMHLIGCSTRRWESRCDKAPGISIRRFQVPMIERFTDFDADPVTVARRLLGQRLVRVLDGERLAGIIVETEAYLGQEDRAAHTFGGRRTQRNESMYLPGGHAYVYFTYGMHHCLNVVCGGEDEGVAVLIRALEPVEGVETMFARRARARTEVDLCSGPAKLAEALGIDRSMDGVDFRRHSDLFIEKILARTLGRSRIAISPRIGVTYAKEWALELLRFYIQDNRNVSRAKTTSH